MPRILSPATRANKPYESFMVVPGAGRVLAYLQAQARRWMIWIVGEMCRRSPLAATIAFFL